MSRVLIPSNVKKEAFQLPFLAEREGFEPPVPFSTSVFKTGAIDHSATSPRVVFQRKCGLFSFDDAKVYQKNIPCKKNGRKFEFFAIFFVFHIHMPLKCVVIVMMWRDIAPALTGEIDEDWF